MKLKVDSLKVEPINARKSVISLVVNTRDINTLPDTTKPLQAEITQVKRKRSLTANSYAWLLMDKIATVIRSTKEEVYRKAIKEVGVFTDIAVRTEGYNKLKVEWERKGIGYLTEIISETSFVVDCRMYYGSSTYNSSEMARLIDWIVDKAEELGIETITPKDRSLLIEEWGNV